MKVVVTGGAGFIGANLSRTLSQHPEVTEVVAVDDLSTGFRSNLEGIDAELVEGTILDQGFLEESFRGAEAVVHLAARPSVPRSLADPLASHTANATGTITVLEAIRTTDVPSVIIASSSSVYGANPAIPKHEDLATLPMSPYAASKLAGESYALAYQASFGVNALCFRFFNVFGPLQPAGHAYAAVVPAFISAALKGEPLVVHGDGTQTRDFTFVETVTATITEAVVGRVSHPRPVNLAFGTRVNLLTVIEMLEKLVGEPLRVDHVEGRTGDVKHSQADQTELRSLFPQVEPVDLETGLRATLAWMEANLEAKAPTI